MEKTASPQRSGGDVGAACLAAVAALVPAGLAAAYLPNLADAAHDCATVRVLGLAPRGVFRALDSAVGAAFVVLPLGTRAFRAGLASTLCLAIAAALLFDAAERRARGERKGERGLGRFAALVVAFVGAFAPAMQVEATSAGGATLGLVLAMMPRALVMRGASAARVALCVGLACSYEPVVGLLAIAAISPTLVATLTERSALRRASLSTFAWTLAGATPLVAAVALTRPARGARFVDAMGEGWGPAHSPLGCAVEQLGVVVVGMALGGLAVAFATPALRAHAAGSLAVITIAGASIFMGAALGPDRYAAPALALVAEIALLASTAIAATVRFVRATNVMFARPSGWLVVLMFAALPARQADDAIARLASRQGRPERAFALLTWERLPLGSLVLVRSAEVSLRIAAARAQGDVRGDVLFVPMGEVSSLSLVSREPALVPLLRDQVLYGAPLEWSLSALAAKRPLLLSFDAGWPRPLSRHLVAAGLFDRYYPEPRGLSDRRVALDAQNADRLALLRALTATANPDIARAVATGFRARLIGAAASGERDIAGRVLDELRPVSPADPVAFEIARRLVGVRGAIDVSDLKRP